MADEGEMLVVVLESHPRILYGVQEDEQQQQQQQPTPSILEQVQGSLCAHNATYLVVHKCEGLRPDLMSTRVLWK